MNNYILKCCVLAIALLAPAVAQGQGIVNGATSGAERGNDAAGPVGAIVGGAVGAVTGGINGLLGIDQRPRFREYVVKEHRPSYQYDESLAVGVVLPVDGVEYYEIPAQYGVTQYRYTVVNKRVVLVEPGTRRIVQIVE